MAYLKSFSTRHALSSGFAVFTAVLINYYFSFSKEGWVVLTAFLVSQTTRGTPLKQGIYFFLIIIMAILLSSFILLSIKQIIIIDIILSLMFIICSYITFINQPLSNQSFLLVIFFSVVLLIAALSPAKTSQLMQNRVADAVIGGVVGILFSQFVLPVRFGMEFRAGLIPILRALADYSHALTVGFLHKDSNENILDQKPINIKKANVKKALQTQQGIYPEWVYETGFNPGLRSGFRFFLINLEHMTDLFFSIDYLISRDVDAALLKALSNSFSVAMQKNDELFHALIDCFENNKIKNTESDFISDISELENTLRHLVPDNLEILDLSPDNITLIALVRNIKDLRGLLLQLVMALPQ